jgi:hypothetical protein
MRRRKQDKIGYIDIPMEYCDLDINQKREVCNNIIDILLRQIDKDLAPEINRITFLDEILESSLISNEELEQFEICACLLDIRKILNED